MDRLILMLAMILYQTVVIVLVLGGTGYVVFILHHSGWWFALAVPLALAFTQIEMKINPKETPE